jgi:hypothetical protein
MFLFSFFFSIPLEFSFVLFFVLFGMCVCAQK